MEEKQSAEQIAEGILKEIYERFKGEDYYFEFEKGGIAQHREIKLVLMHCLNQLIDFNKSGVLNDDDIKTIANELISAGQKFKIILYEYFTFLYAPAIENVKLTIEEGISKEQHFFDVSFGFGQRSGKIRLPEGLFLTPKNLRHFLLVISKELPAFAIALKDTHQNYALKYIHDPFEKIQGDHLMKFSHGKTIEGTSEDSTLSPGGQIKLKFYSRLAPPMHGGGDKLAFEKILSEDKFDKEYYEKLGELIDDVFFKIVDKEKYDESPNDHKDLIQLLICYAVHYKLLSTLCNVLVHIANKKTEEMSRREERNKELDAVSVQWKKDHPRGIIDYGDDEDSSSYEEEPYNQLYRERIAKINFEELIAKTLVSEFPEMLTDRVQLYTSTKNSASHSARAFTENSNNIDGENASKSDKIERDNFQP